MFFPLFIPKHFFGPFSNTLWQKLVFAEKNKVFTNSVKMNKNAKVTETFWFLDEKMEKEIVKEMFSQFCHSVIVP